MKNENAQGQVLKSGDTEYLRLIKDNLVIDSCDGTDTIMVVNLYELVNDATTSEVFRSPGSIEDRCLTDAQREDFVKKHRDEFKTNNFYTTMEDNWYAIMFPFKSLGRLFVKVMCVANPKFGCFSVVMPSNISDFRVGVTRFEDLGVWRAADQYRIVVPQLA